MLTTTRRLGPGQVALTGPVTDTAGVAAAQAQASGGDWQFASVSGNTWRAPYVLGSDPDGVAYSVTALVTDLGGHTAQVTRTVTVDIVPPAPVTLTLTSDGSVITPGMTLRTLSPTLTISWTASSDGSGLGDYLVRWTAATFSATTTYMTAHDPAGSLTTQYQAGEAQMITLQFASQDIYGNQTWQTFGPVFVDSSSTPDYVPLSGAYHRWMDSGCSLIGVDHRVNQYAPNMAALNVAQQFYATWNSEALRLAWSGANWNTDGDLFIYLDTQPGGTGELYNPYTTTLRNVNIYLPGNTPGTFAKTLMAQQPPTLVTAATARQANAAARASTGAAPLILDKKRSQERLQASASDAMLADYLVWIRGSTNAQLLYWEGSAWVVQAALGSQNFRLDANATPALTDLYLPFSWLGITDPGSATLDLLAVASQKDTLGLWAVMPERNPVNGEQVVNPLSGAAGDQTFMLTRQYHWASLGSGQCPSELGSQFGGSSLRVGGLHPMNGSSSAFADSDLHVSIALDPVGTSYAFMGNELSWLWNVLFGTEGTQVNSQNFFFMDVRHPPLGDGQLVTYTIQYANRGTQTATGVKVDINAYYSLDLPDGVNYGYWENKTISLGDVTAGMSATYIFTGTVSVTGAGQARYDQCILDGFSPTVCQPMLRWASLDAYVYDDRSPLVYDAFGNPTEPPLEWVWVDHHVDSLAPQFLGIDSPQAVIRPYTNTVRGYVYDESDVPALTLEWKPTAGITGSVPCADATPSDGRWECEWDVGAAADGDTFDLRAQATDRFGYVSNWTPWRTLVVDTIPPTVTVNANAMQAINEQMLGVGSHVLKGSVFDNHYAGSVQVCRPGPTGEICEPAAVQLTTDSLTGTAVMYDDAPAGPLAINSTTTCGGGELTRTINVPDDLVIGNVQLGFNANHSYRDDVQVELVSPSGTRVRVIYGLGSLYDQFSNYDVMLNDSSTQPLHVTADDDTAAPYYDREARPYQPLAAFNGENAAGDWTLYICDVVPEKDDGWYNRSRLILSSQVNARATSGTWFYTLPIEQGADGLSRTLTVYGLDAVGNRTPEPITVTYQLDVVPPALTVTTVLTQHQLPNPLPVVLGGQMTDGSGLGEVYIRVDSLDAASYTGQATRDGADWSYIPPIDKTGVYTLWVEALDGVGNITPAGPFQLRVYEMAHVYMPLVARNSPAPDLVGSLSLSTGSIAPDVPVTVIVTVTNQGNLEASNFYVDFYINPSTPPTAANQPWTGRCSMSPCYGIRWYVLGILRPGESVTFDSNPNSYDGTGTNWPGYLPSGTTQLYLYVDSISGDGSPNGFIPESDETNNRAALP